MEDYLLLTKALLPSVTFPCHLISHNTDIIYLYYKYQYFYYEESLCYTWMKTVNENFYFICSSQQISIFKLDWYLTKFLYN